jgi:hypothetical protein
VSPDNLLILDLVVLMLWLLREPVCGDKVYNPKVVAAQCEQQGHMAVVQARQCQLVFWTVLY